MHARVLRMPHELLCTFADSHCRAGIVITNDGNAILREIDVSHPAAKVCAQPACSLFPRV